MRHRIVRTKESTLDHGGQYIISGQPRDNKGQWKKVFENENPIWLEIGSGKGQFLCTQAINHPEKNFLACEGLDDVYVRIIEKCIENKITNLKIIPCFMDHATEFFEDGELEKIFINFCDPWPKKKHIKRRLTNRDKLEEYKRIIGKGNLIQFKTDNDPLFEFTLEEVDAADLETLEMTRDLKNSIYELSNIHTEYEDKFTGVGKTINYIVCRVKDTQNNLLRGRKVFLASGSPRRKELMRKITNDFEIIIPEVDERTIEEKLYQRFEVEKPDHAPMQDIACVVSMELASAKANAVRKILDARGEKNYLIIGCDTSVAIKDEILGKPKDRDDAVRMLRAESQNVQYVVSGVSMIRDLDEADADAEKKFCAITEVHFHPLDENQEEKIQAYCDTDEPYDKAGAYGIQLYGDGFVEKIIGSRDNVVGFPVEKIIKELKKI
ncbi:MAG: tRNA (guanosine(46)-N7)-methyltransferase TrmB [Bacillota bacterium]|nr:tRNA (guanosine(46)-N7)-methyltransferase TrmB [Bacillota bacterium]